LNRILEEAERVERRIPWDSIGARAMLIARALGFVVLVYFVPVLLRDVSAQATGSDGLLSLLAGATDRPLIPLVFVLASLAVSVAFVLLHARTGPEAKEPRPLLAFDRAAIARWSLGFGAGVAIIVLGNAVLAAGGILRVEGISRTIAERPVLAIAVLVALLAESLREELAFRGPSQRDLSRVIGFPFAAAFLSASFTLLHLANPNAKTTGLLGVFLAGMALAGVVRREGDLSLAAGLHAGWNVTLGMIVSVPVSGILLGARLLDTRLEGGALATGGEFGFESSVVGIVTLFFCGWAAWRWKSERAP
jgi:membrane protease YdiL (CAAX protease family)